MRRFAQVVHALLAMCLLSGCVTKSMWDSATDRRGDITKNENTDIQAFWTVGSDRLGIRTTARKHAREVVMQHDSHNSELVAALLTSAHPHSCRVELHLLTNTVKGGTGELEISGSIEAPARGMATPPARTLEDDPTWRHLRHSLPHFLPADTKRHHRVKVGGWLLGGNPLHDHDRVREAWGNEHQPPDFHSLRQLELWFVADKRCHAVRADALWFDHHANCRLQANSLEWSYLTAGVTVAHRGAPLPQRMLPAPGKQSGLIIWHQKRSRTWAIVGASLATPITVTVDLVGGVLGLLIYASISGGSGC